MATIALRQRLIGSVISKVLLKPHPASVFACLKWGVRHKHEKPKVSDHIVSPTIRAIRTKPSVEICDPPELLEVHINEKEQWLETHWSGQCTAQYPYLWLRDNCTCPKCFHPFTKARLILMPDLQMDAKPANVKLSEVDKCIEITWEDGHFSKFTDTWLWERRFKDESHRKRKGYIHRYAKLWGSEMQNDIREFDFEQVLSDNATLYDWICTMEDYGFAMFKNTPLKTGQLERLAKHISFIRPSHYGQTFQVKASAKPSNLAYTSGNLNLHTDYPYDRYPPGIQFLHCIIQTPTEGGLSQFSDAFNAAQQLRHGNPEAFRILCETPVDYIDVGTDTFGKFSKMQPHYTIQLDHEGDVFRVTYSNQCRDSYQRVTPKEAEQFLRALHEFDSIMYREENIIKMKPEPGDVTCFYNGRVLHGRTSYEVTPGLERHLEGLYIDVDEITSKRRVLEEEFFQITAI